MVHGMLVIEVIRSIFVIPFMIIISSSLDSE